MIEPGGISPRDLVCRRACDLIFLPAASPELQPAERLWTLVDEPIVNRAFPDLDALETVLVERCRAWRPIPSASKPTPISTGGPPSHRQESYSD